MPPELQATSSESSPAPMEPPQPKGQSQTPPDQDPQATQSGEPEKAKARGLVEAKTFNEQIILIGKKGCGKSTWMVKQLLAWARMPAYCFMHDPGWKTPATLYDGTPSYAREFNTAADARAAFMKDPRGIFCVSRGSAIETLQLAEEVAQASLDAHEGVEGHPAIFAIDEAVTSGICDTHSVDQAFLECMAEARHRHVGILAGAQSSRILNNKLLTLCTKLVLFQVTDQRDHRRLMECGVSRDVVAKLPTLKPGQCIAVTL